MKELTRMNFSRPALQARLNLKLFFVTSAALSSEGECPQRVKLLCEISFQETSLEKKTEKGSKKNVKMNEYRNLGN